MCVCVCVCLRGLRRIAMNSHYELRWWFDVQLERYLRSLYGIGANPAL